MDFALFSLEKHNESTIYLSLKEINKKLKKFFAGRYAL